MPVTPIVVETGTGLDPAANSYVSQADATQFAADRGKVIPAGDPGAILIYQAMDYLRQFDSQWLGSITQPGVQPLAWARTGIDGIAPDEIPQSLIDAQCQLCIEAMNGPLLPSYTGAAFITREKVGPIETEYSDAVNTAGVPYYPQVDIWLSSLLNPSSGQALVFYRA